MRINKFLALNLNISRRDADKLIEKKEININGNYAKLGELVGDNDVVSYKNQIINSVKDHKYYKFYKPKNYVSSRSSQGNSKTIYELINNKNLKYSGRLDKDSEGLMLLSTDGDWLNNNSHPSKELVKKYIVTTNLEEIDITKFKKSIIDKNENLNIYSIKKVSKYEYLVILKTGKNREIRNICKYFSWNIVKLIRIQYGPYKLGNLKEGKIEEIKVIRDA